MNREICFYMRNLLLHVIRLGIHAFYTWDLSIFFKLCGFRKLKYATKPASRWDINSGWKKLIIYWAKNSKGIFKTNSLRGVYEPSDIRTFNLLRSILLAQILKGRYCFFTPEFLLSYLANQIFRYEIGGNDTNVQLVENFELFAKKGLVFDRFKYGKNGLFLIASLAVSPLPWKNWN